MVLLTPVVPRESHSVFNAFRSSKSSLEGVNGLAFNACWTKHIVVVSTGNFRRRYLRIANIAFLQLRTSLSRTSPKCGVPGESNFHMIHPGASRSRGASRCKLLKRFLNSRAGPTKLVPLSLMAVSGLTGLSTNLLIAIKHVSVSSPFTNFRWTVVVTKHINEQHQCFTGLRITWTSNGPE